MNHLVSIITPSYNCEKFIGSTIKAVLDQTYTSWELIIVDDFSTDNSIKVIQEYEKQDKRIKLIQLDENKGAANARNISLANASGEYVAFLDSDDLWLPNKLELQLNFMIHNNYLFTCTMYMEVDEEGKETGVFIKVKPKADYEQVLKSCPVGNSTVMCHVSVLKHIIVPDIKRNNDFALWLKILKVTPFIYGLDQVLTQYRVRQNSISSNKFSMVKYHWKLFREIEHISFVKSAILLIGWFGVKLLKLKQE